MRIHGDSPGSSGLAGGAKEATGQAGPDRLGFAGRMRWNGRAGEVRFIAGYKGSEVRMGDRWGRNGASRSKGLKGSKS